MRSDLEENGGPGRIQRLDARLKTAPPRGRAAASIERRGQFLPERPLPVRFETRGMRGTAYATRAALCSKASSIGLESAPNGTHARRRALRPLIPSAAQRSSSCCTAPASPDTTVSSGPLTAAIDTPARESRPRWDATSASAANTAAIAPPGGQRLHQPAARGDQRQAVLEAEDARHARGHVLADAVAEHDGRLDAPRPPQLAPARTRGRTAPAGCRPSGRSATRRRLARTARRASGRSSMRLQQRRAGVDGVAEHRLALVERAAHAGVLRALAGEQERDLRAFADLSAPSSSPWRPVAVGDASQRRSAALR